MRGCLTNQAAIAKRLAGHRMAFGVHDMSIENVTKSLPSSPIRLERGSGIVEKISVGLWLIIALIGRLSPLLVSYSLMSDQENRQSFAAALFHLIPPGVRANSTIMANTSRCCQTFLAV